MKIPPAIKKALLRSPSIRSYDEARKFRDHWSRFYPPGHFYSPIPSDEDVERCIKSHSPACVQVGLDLGVEAQKILVAELSRNYGEIPFKEKPADGLRYYYDNPFFSYSDAIFLHLLLRHLKPRRIVEVGSGFSSAVTLDTIDRFLAGDTRVTFIEPFTERLRKLLRPEDSARCTILEKGVQDAALETFTALDAGDVLFVDSSHVSKAGSDVNFLVFEVFPRLKPGVWLHIHDVFANFDYPDDWLREGRAWNESYLVRAFLLFNESFEVRLLAPLIVGTERDWFGKNMPDCLKNTGGSLWLRRKK